MLKVESKQVDQKTVVYLSGVIDETVDFSKSLGTLPSEVTFSCQKIDKINSNGVKSWIIFFASLARSGTKFSFKDMSVPLVEQLNSLENFPCGAQVESIESPYLCTNPSCKKETKVIHLTTEITPGKDPAPIKCPHCGSNAEFDDLADEYYSFLECA